MFEPALAGYPNGLTTGNDLKELAEIVLKQCCGSHMMRAMQMFAEKDFRLYAEFATERFEKLKSPEPLACLEMAEDPQVTGPEFLEQLVLVLQQSDDATAIIAIAHAMHFRRDDVMAFAREGGDDEPLAILVIEL